MNDLSNLTQTFTTTPSLAAGTTTTYSTTGVTNYCIKGKAYTKAAVTNGATPTIDAYSGKAFKAIPAGSRSVFVYGFNAAGNVIVQQGSIETGAAPQFPILIDDMSPIGYQIVNVGATGAAWTFGTSNNSGVANVTYSFQPVMMLPDRPQFA